MKTSQVPAAVMINERRLSRLRSHPALFGENDEASERITRLLHRCKARLMPYWEARSADVKHAAGQRLLQTWA